MGDAYPIKSKHIQTVQFNVGPTKGISESELKELKKNGNSNRNKKRPNIKLQS